MRELCNEFILHLTSETGHYFHCDVDRCSWSSGRPSVADWGDGVSASWLHCGSNCPLARAMDGHIIRCGTVGSCQSAATFEIVKRCWSRV